MARVGIIFGLILCGLTVVGLVSSLTKIPAQFIPMMLGIPILFCGVVALNPHRRKQAMNVSVVIALAGVVIGGVRVTYAMIRWASSEDVNDFAFKMVSAMSVICLVFVGLCVISFIQDRRRHTADSAHQKAGTISDPKAKKGKSSELEAAALGPNRVG